jgi:hypothetical protein
MQFATKFTCTLNQLLRIETALSTAYHPQTDGQMEQINQELEQYLHLYVNHMQTDWANWLPIAKFAYNNQGHSAISFSPFYLEYGCHPHIPTVPEVPMINNPAANDFADALSQARQVTYDALCNVTTSMKRFMDQKWKESPMYTVGQQVWLDAQNLKTEHLSKKLDLRHLSPFEVIGLVPHDAAVPSTYHLALLPSWKIHLVFYMSLL